jgi:cell wall-associated NlpC family hydrolase
MSGAKQRGQWVAAPAKPKEILPGSLVLFNWPAVGRTRGDGTANHVGLVVEARAEGVATIEFNTAPDNDKRTSAEKQRDGGIVAHKFREYRTARLDGSFAEPILGFVVWH